MEVKKKCKTFCCVANCGSVAYRRPDLSFHLFPKKKAQFVFVELKNGKKGKVDRRFAWEYALKMRKKVSVFMKVCSLHFKPEDFHLSSFNKTKHILKKNAVPSCNLPIEAHESKLTSTRKKRVRKNELKNFSHYDECSIQNFYQSVDENLENIQHTVEELEAAETILGL